MTTFAFAVGDPVVKTGGAYEFPGTVRAAFATLGGAVRSGYCHGSGGESMREAIHEDPQFRIRLFLAWNLVSGRPVGFESGGTDYFKCGC